MLQHGIHLLAGNVFEPRQEIIHFGPVLEIFEQRFDRHPCASEDPSAAHLVRRTLHRRAIFPIEHELTDNRHHYPRKISFFPSQAHAL